jgi:protein phosphatase
VRQNYSIHQSDDPYSQAVRVAALTNKGMRRRSNQDSYIGITSEGKTNWTDDGHMFIVADGMGAHAAGEKASSMAIEHVPHQYWKRKDGLPVERLHRAMIDANNEIYRRGQANPDFYNMGTTASTLVLLPEGGVCAHVGDSRIYRLRDQTLEQLTFDHSLIWEMQGGNITDEALNASQIPKNVITRSLGPNASVLIDLEGPFPLRVGDKFLLCSDGLSGQLDDMEIGILMGVLPPDEAVQVLIDLANLRGGPDNITAIIVEISKELIASNPLAIASEVRRQQPIKFSLPFAITCAICTLTSIVMLLFSQWSLAIVALVLSVISLVAGVFQMLSAHGRPRGAQEKYGKAPYRKFDARPNQIVAERLSGLLQGLRELSTEKGWNIDWSILDNSNSPANVAIQNKDFAAAIRAYALRVSSVIKELPKLSDSDSDPDF